MDKQQINVGKKINHLIPLFLIGIGLLILGFVINKVITDGTLSSEYTVIPTKVNFPAPDLTLNDLDGERVTISNYRDRIVLINNWATWCPPCKAEMPTLSSYYKAHSDHGFILFGIEAGDSKEQVEKFVDEYNLSFPILLDPNSKSMILFNNNNLPSSYVIDRNGNVVLAWTGPINREMLEKYVTPLLEQ